MTITSRQNARVRRIASLKEKKYREQYGEYTVEGVKMVREAIALGLPVREVAGIAEAIADLPKGNYEILETDENVFFAMSGTKTPQGVLAVIRLPENKAAAPRGNCAVLDGVSDPGNLGTIIRTCAALGMKDVYLCNCADAHSPKTVRASMSGIFFTDIHEFAREKVAELISGCTVVAADMNGENIFGAQINEPFALVVGNEAHGLSEFFREKAEKIISLPMQAGVESLNVSVAFAVAAYTLAGKAISK